MVAGTPATIAYGGTFFVTTAPAPTIAPLPILTFGKIIAPRPIHVSCPIKVRFFLFFQKMFPLYHHPNHINKDGK